MAQARSVPRFQDEQRDFIIQKLIEKDINKLTHREIVAEMCAKFPATGAGRSPEVV